VLCSSRSQNYDATCRLAQEIAENIHERNRQQRTGGNPAKVTMQSEADRRQNLIDDLLTREKQLNATFKGDSTEPGPSRSTLMAEGGGASRGVAANPWLVNETEETRGLDFGEIKQQQQRIIEAQDAGLDALAAVISRQKIMGQEIGNELDEQNVAQPGPAAAASRRRCLSTLPDDAETDLLARLAPREQDGHREAVYMTAAELWSGDGTALRLRRGRRMRERATSYEINICVLLVCLLQGTRASTQKDQKIIDDLAHLVDKTDDRIRNETRRVKLVETKSASCG
ncbi:Syntaxin-8, partial [Nibea albiflora]